MLRIRKARWADFDRIMEIYRYAQDFMIATGNPTQWGHFNPTPEMIRADIAAGRCHVLFDGQGVHGVFALFTGEDPTYAYIENGRWLNDGPYVTVHRMAGDGQARGIFRGAMDYLRVRADNIRIDTHENNRVMQSLAEKYGFTRCGIIYLANGSPRIAYQWEKPGGRFSGSKISQGTVLRPFSIAGFFT